MWDNRARYGKMRDIGRGRTVGVATVGVVAVFQRLHRRLQRHPDRPRIEHDRQQAVAQGVVELVLQRPRPEEPPGPRLLQHLDQGRAQAGEMTTRRLGSSPWDEVTTPSMSMAVSWTTLRSAGDMGSSTVA